MNVSSMKTAIIVTLVVSNLGATASVANELTGSWQCQPAATLIFQEDNQLSFNGERSYYQLMPGNILVQEEFGWQPYPYVLSQETLSVQFPDGSYIQCQRILAKSRTQPQGKTQAEIASQDNNASLQQQIAGIWWGYSGSTERKIGLCPGGYYQDYTESSYSGRSFNMSGDETMAWGSANQNSQQGRWRIQGDTNSGTISVETTNGSAFHLTYRQIGEPGCLDINGRKLCRTTTSCE